MTKLAKKFAECEEHYPDAWRLGTELADSLYESRTSYLLNQTRTEEGAARYVEITSEELVKAAASGALREQFDVDFPDPLTELSLSCFGIAVGKRLRDRFDDEGEDRT